MSGILFYILKVALCSALLTGYYFLALRNRVFHQWNRFYLLLTVLLSLTVPFFQYEWLTQSDGQPGAIRLLQVIQKGQVEEESITAGFNVSINWNAWVVTLYAIISFIAILLFVRSLLRLKHITSSNPVQDIDGVRFVNTNVPGTPFSFFHTIFWNRSIDVESNNGRQILQHELVHVREWHSLDKILMQVVLIFSWWNPVFWILRHELKMIHEFIADRKAVTNRDVATLATLILQSACPQQYNRFINPFFHQPIKRRLAMLNRLHNPRISYVGRLLILPLAVITLFAFTICTKQNSRLSTGTPITVVIDAGHDAINEGAVVDGLKESELTLALAKDVADLNRDPKIHIVLTRNNGEIVNLKQRVAIADRENANAFISLHINAQPLENEPRKSGIEILVPNREVPYMNGSILLASALSNSLAGVLGTPQFTTRQIGAYVLNYNHCPSVLLECGYLTNSEDRRFLNKPENRKLLAIKILDAIASYASLNNTETSSTNDSSKNEPLRH
jgi:N-acetylmuramoyl-L-alanine amidase